LKSKQNNGNCQVLLKIYLIMRLQGMPAPCVALLGLGATAPMNVKAAAKKTALSALEMYNPDTKVGFRLRGRLSPLRAMKQLRILILRVWHGATENGP
jgi:hypothetical protein